MHIPGGGRSQQPVARAGLDFAVYKSTRPHIGVYTNLSFWPGKGTFHEPPKAKLWGIHRWFTMIAKRNGVLLLYRVSRTETQHMTWCCFKVYRSITVSLLCRFPKRRETTSYCDVVSDITISTSIMWCFPQLTRLSMLSLATHHCLSWRICWQGETLTFNASMRAFVYLHICQRIMYMQKWRHMQI